MKKFISLFAALSVVLALGAQDYGSITSIAIPADAVSAVMGSVASTDNAAFAAENNITTSVFMKERFAFGAAYDMWNVSSSPNHVPSIGAACRFGNLAVALSGSAFLQPAFKMYDEDGASTGSFMPYDMHAAIGVAYALPFGLAIGVTGKLIQSAIYPSYSAICFAGDLYVAYKVKYVTATVAACNFGTPVKYSADGSAGTLPRLVKLGANGQPVKGLQIALEGDYLLNNSSFMLNAAASYTLFEMATLRAGYHYSPASVLPSYASAGAGFRFKGFNIDAAYLFASEVVKNTFVVSLGYSF